MLDDLLATVRAGGNGAGCCSARPASANRLCCSIYVRRHRFPDMGATGIESDMELPFAEAAADLLTDPGPAPDIACATAGCAGGRLRPQRVRTRAGPFPRRSGRGRPVGGGIRKAENAPDARRKETSAHLCSHSQASTRFFPWHAIIWQIKSALPIISKPIKTQILHGKSPSTTCTGNRQRHRHQLAQPSCTMSPRYDVGMHTQPTDFNIRQSHQLLTGSPNTALGSKSSSLQLALQPSSHGAVKPPYETPPLWAEFYQGLGSLRRDA